MSPWRLRREQKTHGAGTPRTDKGAAVCGGMLPRVPARAGRRRRAGGRVGGRGVRGGLELGRSLGTFARLLATPLHDSWSPCFTMLQGQKVKSRQQGHDK